MATERREMVVIGAGVFGLSATLELAVRGRDVLCLELATIGNDWSGSKGSSRMFRLGYDDPLYVSMAIEALELWRGLEAASGEPLIDPCGLLSVGHRLDQLQVAMRAAGASAEFLDEAAVIDRYPGVRVAGGAVLDATAGVLRADRVLDVTATLARAAGAELRERSKVSSLAVHDAGVTVATSVGTVEASRAIVCAGPGSSALFVTNGTGTRTLATLEQVAYFAAPVPQLPAVVRRDDPPVGVGGGGTLERLGFYAMPVRSLGLFKVGLHGAGPAVAPGADERGVLATDPALLQRIVDAVVELVPGVDPAPRLDERCVYDNTADGDFVIDAVGPLAGAFGTSGHGFKFAPLIGQLLADLACDLEPRFDLSRFSSGRPAVARG